jgi:hypothetical protein
VTEKKKPTFPVEQAFTNQFAEKARTALGK